MNAPAWLSNLFSILMVAVVCYSLWRLLIARVWGRAVDYETDGLHLLAGIAAASLITNWARTLPRPAWAVVFVVAGVYFAYRAAWAWDAADRRRRSLGGLGCCAVLVYAFTSNVAPSTLNGSTAGQHTMAGMPGMIVDQTERFPALGLLLVVALAFAAVAVVNRAGSMPPAEEGRAPAAGGPKDVALSVLTPRTAEVCRVLLLLTLVYAILSKLV
jgi:hypothetical protein